MFDQSGHRYIDFLGGCSALNYGHNDPDMADALVGHISRSGVSMGLDMYTDAKARFLASFEENILAPRGFNHRVQFTGPTGTNAVEAAMKLARKVTGRPSIVSFTNGFHGVSLGALAATGNRHHRMGASLPGIARAPFDGYHGPAIDTAEMLDQLLSDPSSGFDAPAAVLFETVQGEGGLNVASGSWVRAICEIARRHGALVIVDDIQAGCGRTGSFFSFDGLDVAPDMITLSKSLSGFGLPMAVLLHRAELDQWSPGEHNGTFRGNTHAILTAQVAIEKFWSAPDFAADVKRKAEIVATRLADLQTVAGGRLKGRGMMQGLDVGSGELAAAICAEAFANGLIIETSGSMGQVIKVLAPLTTPDLILHEGFDLLRRAAIDTFARFDGHSETTVAPSRP